MTNRDFFYGQTTYKNSDKLTALVAFRYDSERGYTAYDYQQQSASRGNYDYIVQTFGNLGNRLYYSAGTDLPYYSVFGFQPTPHATAAYYLSRPTAAGTLSGTKVRFNYSQGILEPTIAEQRGSIYDVLNSLPDGKQLIAQERDYSPVGAQQTTTYEAGLISKRRGNSGPSCTVGIITATFTNQIEFVDASRAIATRRPPASVEEAIANSSYGAYINSLKLSALRGSRRVPSIVSQIVLYASWWIHPAERKCAEVLLQ